MAAPPTFDTADWPLQKAIHTALEDALSVPVVDHYDDEALPIVEIGDVIASTWSTQTTRGQEHICRVRAMSEARGAKEVKQLKSQICAELDNQRFDLTGDGFSVRHAEVINANVTRYMDQGQGRVIRQANIEVRYLITNV
jgi:hypothetical protein